jgi:branched-chain amino acid transport system permease protein
LLDRVGDLPQEVVLGLGIGAIYGLVAIGFSLIYRTTGLLSFVHPEMVMLGSLLGYTATTDFDLPIGLAVIPVAVVTGVLAFAIDQIGIRPIRRRRGTLVSLILATVGWGVVLANAASLVYGANTRAYPVGRSRAWSLLGVEVRWETLAVIASALAIAGVLHVFLHRTRPGREVRAVGDDSDTAPLMGIDVERSMGLSAGIGGALGGMAGVFIGWLFFAGLTVNTFGLKSLAAAVIGGFGNIPGALIGGLLIGVLDIQAGVTIDSKWRDATVFLLVIVVLLVRPRGLFGRRAHVRS